MADFEEQEVVVGTLAPEVLCGGEKDGARKEEGRPRPTIAMEM